MNNRSAIATVVFGHAAESLDFTFTSFADKNPGLPLHAFILSDRLPRRQLPSIQYHLVPPIPDFSDALREVYYRRLELIDRLDADIALVVDCYDVLCLQPLPSFSELLAGAPVAACVEHQAARYVLGQQYTANFLNGGVFFWNITKSREIRREIVARGRRHFRTVADDQYCLNEVLQTKYFDQVRILPCQYNYRAYLNRQQKGWPTVTHLDGVKIYHNASCMDEAKRLAPFNATADLPDLPDDGGPLPSKEQMLRKLRLRFTKHVIK